MELKTQTKANPTLKAKNNNRKKDKLTSCMRLGLNDLSPPSPTLPFV